MEKEAEFEKEIEKPGFGPTPILGQKVKCRFLYISK